MTRFFDGKQFVRRKETQLIKEIEKLKNKGINPKLVSILIGNDGLSVTYLKMKKAFAKRMGLDLEIQNMKHEATKTDVVKLIQKLNKIRDVHGVMIQLPLPVKYSKKDREIIINTIALDKDIDGMKDDSPFIAPVALAVLGAFDQALKVVLRKPSTSVLLNALVVGSKGFEGKKILEALREKGFMAKGVDKETKNLKLNTKKADVIVSATGVTNLIKTNMVKSGVALIDVGSPKGDVEKKAYEKASFVSPVPGGVGPLTIMFLMDNLVKGCKNLQNVS